jgi:glycosyltransferase involved in cell wall biosynthesis
MSDLVSLMRLIACFRREKPWMVHSMTPKAGLLCMMAAWVAREPRRVHTFTGLVWPTKRGAKRLLLKTMDRLLCACATHIIPEGQGVKRDIENGRITSKPMRVLANGNVRGIDLEHYSLSPQIKAEAERLRCADKLTFVFVGRLVADKGINELVEAFDIVSRNRNDVRLVLVGGQETKLDPLTDKTLATIEANENIVAVGQQSDVRPWLAAADVFVFPSYREGFPNVVIEAGTMGLP